MSLYDKAVDREKEEIPQEDIIKDEILAQWKHSLPTKNLLTFLINREIEYLNTARNLACVRFEDENIIRNLLRAKTIREIIDYINESEE